MKMEWNRNFLFFVKPKFSLSYLVMIMPYNYDGQQDTLQEDFTSIVVPHVPIPIDKEYHPPELDP